MKKELIKFFEHMKKQGVDHYFAMKDNTLFQVVPSHTWLISLKVGHLEVLEPEERPWKHNPGQVLDVEDLIRFFQQEDIKPGDKVLETNYNQHPPNTDPLDTFPIEDIQILNLDKKDYTIFNRILNSLNGLNCVSIGLGLTRPIKEDDFESREESALYPNGKIIATSDCSTVRVEDIPMPGTCLSYEGTQAVLGVQILQDIFKLRTIFDHMEIRIKNYPGDHPVMIKGYGNGFTISFLVAPRVAVDEPSIWEIYYDREEKIKAITSKVDKKMEIVDQYNRGTLR